jgi:hypothetical protein
MRQLRKKLEADPERHNIFLPSQGLGIVLSRMNKTRSSSRRPWRRIQRRDGAGSHNHNIQLTTPQQWAFFICPLHDWSYFLSPFYADLLG